MLTFARATSDSLVIMDFPPFARTSLDSIRMNSLPIEPGWILEGSPSARVASLSRSPDGMTWVDLWDCTAGKFHWHYHLDEVAHILDGEAAITDIDGTVWQIRAGEVVTFRHSSRALWHVPHYIRKVAIMYRPLPPPINALLRLRDRARNLVGKLGRRLGATTHGGAVVVVADVAEWVPLLAL